MNLEQEFNKYAKDFSKKLGYEIDDKEIKDIYDDFFGEAGTINFMLTSKIKDLEYEKENTKEQDQDMDLGN